MVATSVSQARTCISTFQSPFQSGNGCYASILISLSVRFSSGQWLLPTVLPRYCVLHQSVFSSGQWLLPCLPAQCYPAFSPLFIGAMVATSDSNCCSRLRRQSPFSSGQTLVAHALPTFFQSPFHRGNGCYFGGERVLWHVRRLSVPFSSGQWLLPWLLTFMLLVEDTFSPLFVGAMVATYNRRMYQRSFSPLFIGAMVATKFIHEWAGNLLAWTFSPLFAGQWLLLRSFMSAFSPLFVGAMVATNPADFLNEKTFSPLFSGQSDEKLASGTSPFSPLFIAAMVATS